MKELHKKPWVYTLTANEEETLYILKVVCGTVALFDVEVQLTPEEIANYRKNGLQVIDDLVNNIQTDPEKFMRRK